VQAFTLGQVLPGPNFSNLAVALGYRLAGIAGGVWGLVAIVLPGAVILVGVATLYLHGAFGGSATLLMRGLSAAVVGLVCVTTLRILRGSLRGGRGILVAAITFLAVGPLRLSTVGVVLVMAAVSLTLHWAAPARSASPAGTASPEEIC
jgi:chromate transporter